MNTLLHIRRATSDDFDQIMSIYRIAQDYMIASGNSCQWGHTYPAPELIRSDIEAGVSYVLCDAEGVHGVFAMFTDPEPTYSYIEGGEWLNDEPYITIHRVASDGTRHGIVRCVMDYAKSLSDNIRIDTHADNATMQAQIEKNGFSKCGTIYVRDRSPRTAYHWTRTKIACVRSGGQSGVDRAALETAKKYGIRICGWCPQGGWAEDFPEPPGVMALYTQLRETASREPEERTVRNVQDADATLIIRPGGADSAGTDLTEKTAEELGKPCMVIGSEGDISGAVEWLRSLPDGLDLNVAGPRESEWPIAYGTACRYLSMILEDVLGE